MNLDLEGMLSASKVVPTLNNIKVKLSSLSSNAINVSEKIRITKGICRAIGTIKSFEKKSITFAELKLKRETLYSSLINTLNEAYIFYSTSSTHSKEQIGLYYFLN